jgi:hypothetical protein
MTFRKFSPLSGPFGQCVTDCHAAPVLPVGDMNILISQCAIAAKELGMAKPKTRARRNDQEKNLGQGS